MPKTFRARRMVDVGNRIDERHPVNGVVYEVWESGGRVVRNAPDKEGE